VACASPGAAPDQPGVQDGITIVEFSMHKNQTCKEIDELHERGMHLDPRHDEEVDEVEPVIIRDSKRQDVTNFDQVQELNVRLLFNQSLPLSLRKPSLWTCYPYTNS
jgi:hypothetical protein